MKKIGRAAAMFGLACLTMVLLLAGCDNPTGSDTTDSGPGGGVTGGTLSGIAESSFVSVPPGSFQRDSTAENVSVITQGFLMSRYPVTQADFEAIMGTSPSSFSSGDDAPTRPVEFVNWYHAIAFANKLSIARGLTPVYTVVVDGVPVDFNTLSFGDVPTSNSNGWNNASANWNADGYRLPTEMERLWAAMGATSGNGYSGSGVYTSGYSKDFPGSDGANSATDYAWYAANSGSSPQPVGQKLPNELGIYDLSGNVGEWVWDWTSTSYPSGTLTNHRGSSSPIPGGPQRVTRGGNWGSSDLADLAIAGRFGLGLGGLPPDRQSNSFGFRLVRNDTSSE